jgi:choline dehydrogenase
LQDRYENGIILNTTVAFTSYENCTFGYPGIPDACHNQWANNTGALAQGPYASNGVPVVIPMKSSVAAQDSEFPNVNDLLVLGGATYFHGYYPNYTDAINLHSWTWLILKAHSRNRAGSVTLTSKDPTIPPEITFNYFNDSTTGSLDRQAVMEAMNFVRAIAGNFTAQPGLGGTTEVVPGPDVDDDATLAEWVDTQSWGHHASCTCPIGADDDPMAVLDAQFRVRGTKGLRVVDASAFPRIPGFFLTVPILMISEKAADVILADIEG